jgi:mxaA protein
VNRHSPVGLALLFYAVGAWAQLPAAIHGVELHARRDFGYVMGEPLRHDIEIKVAKPFELEADFLPQAGSAVNDWLEIRQVEWKREDRGKETIYRIALTYQVFKGVRETETQAVPALPLRFRHGENSIEVEAPAWNFTLTPLISPKTPDENVTLRGDLPPPVYPTGQHKTALIGFLTGIVALLIYAAWRLGLPSFLALDASPFARAGRALKKLRRQPASGEVYRQALRLVHGAINETAGYTVFSGRLDRFFIEHPEFDGLREQFEAFFVTSQGLFFASIELDIPSDFALDRLEALCRESRKIEGRRR